MKEKKSSVRCDKGKSSGTLVQKKKHYSLMVKNRRGNKSGEQTESIAAWNKYVRGGRCAAQDRQEIMQNRFGVLDGDETNCSGRARHRRS